MAAVPNLTLVPPYAPPWALSPHRHAVALYDGEQELVAAVATHLADAVAVGHPMVVVATPEHGSALNHELLARGIDPLSLTGSGALVVLDAAETLATFMVEGAPDPLRFAESIGGLLKGLGGDGPVTVYGEMVALLWDQDNAAGALALERLWNDLARELDFDLLCGYPMSAIEAHPDLHEVDQVCLLHTGLLPPRRYASRRGTWLGSERGDERAEVFLSLPEAVTGVRRWLRSTLIEWGLTALVDDVSVVASELATNAVRHADSPFRASISMVAADRIRVSFEDLADGHPALNSAEHSEVGGRGVHLVAQLAQCWGVEGHAGGKVVWAEFVIPDLTLG